jgi:hypothetical protein
MSGRRKGGRVVAARVVTAERRRLLSAIAVAEGGVRIRPDYRVRPYRETGAEKRVRDACTQARWIETVFGQGAWRMSAARFRETYPDVAAQARAWREGWRPVGDTLTDAGRRVLGLADDDGDGETMSEVKG